MANNREPAVTLTTEDRATILTALNMNHISVMRAWRKARDEGREALGRALESDAARILNCKTKVELYIR